MLRWGLIPLVVLLWAVSARADDGTTTTSTTTTAATTTVATTTVATTTAATTTVATTTAPAPPSVVGTRASLRVGCPTAAVVVVYPKQMPLFLAPPDGKALLDYPAGVSASVERVDASGCSGDVFLRSVSVLGSITAQQVKLNGETPTIAGLQIGTTAAVGRRFPLGWGTLVVGDVTPTYVAALSLTLSREHDGLPSGTQILVGVGPVPPPPKVVVTPHAKKTHKHKGTGKTKSKKATHEPLKVTPKLGVKKLMFPVVGSWGGVTDTYGANRSDVPGGWHHGDDLFAPIGTPLVAVATGTVNRVGWEKLGGWRLWVRDTAGDEFYYAHLSGYAPAVLKSKKVTRGEVIGFVGDTGDAYLTPPHLHFEVHPRPLLHLGYDGAVDPTTYVDKWPHLLSVVAPHPVHPPLPTTPQVRAEAKYVWHELLAARHLIVHRPKATVKARSSSSAVDDGIVASAPLQAGSSSSRSAWIALVVALLLVASAIVGWFARRARKPS